MPSSPQEQAIDVVARTAWGEARSEKEPGMQAVINVIMNRAALRTWYGLNPVAVCLKSCQFSCWNKSDVNRSKLLAANDDDPWFIIARKLAVTAMAGALEDLTDGATHYYAAGTPVPNWVKAMHFTKRVGAHLFYRTAA